MDDESARQAQLWWTFSVGIGLAMAALYQMGNPGAVIFRPVAENSPSQRQVASESVNANSPERLPATFQTRFR